MNKKTKATNETKWFMSHNEPDEFWFGEGYFEIWSSDDPAGHVVTDNKDFADRVLNLLNTETKRQSSPAHGGYSSVDRVEALSKNAETIRSITIPPMREPESPNAQKASKISALISQMERHQNLNKEDMPLVVEILKRELDFLNRLEGNK
jgi:hypothetical protein